MFSNEMVMLVYCNDDRDIDTVNVIEKNFKVLIVMGNYCVEYCVRILYEIICNSHTAYIRLSCQNSGLSTIARHVGDNE